MSENVINFGEKRKENIEKKRRSFERLLFNNLLGAYTVISKEGMAYPIDLVDISHDGCLFQVPWNAKTDKRFENGEEIKLRMYFTKHSYVPVIVNIRYGNEFTADDGSKYMHYGCEFDQSMPSFQAMKEFIGFMYSFAEHSVIDKGDVKSYFL